MFTTTTICSPVYKSFLVDELLLKCKHNDNSKDKCNVNIISLLCNLVSHKVIALMNALAKNSDRAIHLSINFMCLSVHVHCTFINLFSHFLQTGALCPLVDLNCFNTVIRRNTALIGMFLSLAELPFSKVKSVQSSFNYIKLVV